MTWETGLLVGALAAFALGLAADLTGRDRHARLGLHLGTGLVAGALGLLGLYFLVGDLRVEYVFTYTRTTYPWYYRLAGLWGGQKGTLLMWTAFLALAATVLFRQVRRAQDEGSLPSDAAPTVRAMRRGVLALLVLLATSTLVAQTFAATPEYLLRFRPQGNGLQAVLLTPFMVIHPPIQFVFYALTGLLFAGGLAAVATRQAHWATIVRPWARLTWLLATLGLGLGGLWAYYVLNFGGFWAWDPVETANLIAWFPLTLLLHALLRYRQGEYGVVAPLFALSTLPAVVFSTVATRTGLWVSVHAFTDPSKNFARDPLVRLLNILETGVLLRYLVGLLVVLGLLAVFALLVGRAAQADARRRAAWRAGATGVFLAGAAWSLLDPVGLLGAVFQLAHAVTGGRSAAIGLLVLAFGGAAAVLLTAKEHPVEARPSGRPRLERWLTTRNLIAAGIGALAIAFLVVVLLQLMSVNGYDRAVYDARSPIVGLPILLVMGLLFLLPSLGPRKGAMVAGAAFALGVVGALVWPAHWEVALLAPALTLAFAASLRRSLRHANAGAVVSRRDRAATVVLAAGALVGFATWSNPPSHVDLPLVGRLVPAWSWAVPALALASFALAAAYVHAGSARPGLARAGAVALLPLLGPALSATACGVAALVLVDGARRPASSLGLAVAARRHGLRKASVYLLHAALVAGLAGYAMATYESDLYPEVDAARDVAASAGPYTVTVLGSRTVGMDAEQGLPLEIHTRVRIDEADGTTHEATLTHWLVPDDTPGHYDARVTVVRTATRDLYLFPMLSEVGGNELRDHTHEVRGFGGDVERVVLSVKVLPGMSLVWAGLWMLGAAMTANLALGGWAMASTASAASGASARQVHNAAPLSPPAK